MNELLMTLNMMDRNLIFSGQLFFRDRGPAVELDYSTRQIFGVTGIIAVPKHVNLKGESQYAIAGYQSDSKGIILGVDVNGTDLTELARGKTIGGLLTEPIWKI